MSTIVRGRWLAFGVAFMVVVIDQVSKLWVVHHLFEGQTIFVLGPAHLTLVRNPGIAYGLLRSHAEWARWALSAFELAVAGALAVWAWRTDRRFLTLTIGLVMGGAVGNLIDRMRSGAVVDFLDFQSLHFPWVFNIADSAISVGIVLLIIESFFTPRAKTP